MRNALKNIKGFTLIELMLVAAIIGVLSLTVILPANNIKESVKNINKDEEIREIPGNTGDKGLNPEKIIIAVYHIGPAENAVMPVFYRFDDKGRLIECEIKH